jgi:hypothetical protein
MATQRLASHHLATAPAGADLSTKQFRLVKLNEAGKLVLAGAGDIAFSLQENAPEGAQATYANGGEPKAVAGGNIKAGQLVSAGAEGKLVAATATVIEEEKVEALGSRVIGLAVEEAAAGELARFLSTPTAGRA